MRRKNAKADTLIMTATPIPRSLALTIYGDMDMSILKGKPAGRKPITTWWAGEDKRKEVYDFVLSQIRSGRQVFVVCPRIKTAGTDDRGSAEGMFRHLGENIFKGQAIAMVHGGMKVNDKDRIMEDFRRKKYAILVATTVVEVGVDIPNVTIMIVEDAAKYGLAQLHQLRGRIGRGEHESYCILMGEGVTEGAGERLSVISEIDDGFEIAERDLDLRGPGEFLGTKQSGLPELRFGNIVRDFKIMEEAREEAFSLIKADPLLKDPRHAEIRREIAKRFKGNV